MLIGARTSAWMPYDKRVGWIQSDGNCWIDTGIRASNTLKVEMTANIGAYTKAADAFGSYDVVSGTAYRCEFYITSKTTFVAKIGADGGYLNFGGKDLLNEFVFTMDCSRQNITFNGTEYSTSFVPSEYLIRPTIRLFTRSIDENNPKRVGENNKDVRISRFFAENEGKKVCLIPVLKNGVGCFYDEISGKLFTNQGTGVFLYGD